MTCLVIGFPPFSHRPRTCKDVHPLFLCWPWIYTGPRNGLVIPSLDPLVQEYCSLGITPSTKKSYKSAYNQFCHFCSQFQIISPFPVSEALLCYFAAFLAQRALALASIKLYLASVRHMQVSMGYPEPRAASSLLWLRLVLNGISHARVVTDVPSSKKPWLPIATPHNEETVCSPFTAPTFS